MPKPKNSEELVDFEDREMLICTIVFNKKKGTIEAAFQGHWTGRDLQRIQANVPKLYRQHQKARAKAGQHLSKGDK